MGRCRTESLFTASLKSLSHLYVMVLRGVTTPVIGPVDAGITETGGCLKYSNCHRVTCGWVDVVQGMQTTKERCRTPPTSSTPSKNETLLLWVAASDFHRPYCLGLNARNAGELLHPGNEATCSPVL